MEHLTSYGKIESVKIPLNAAFLRERRRIENGNEGQTVDAHEYAADAF